MALSPGCLLNLPGEPSKIKLKCPEIVLLLIRSGAQALEFCLLLPSPNSNSNRLRAPAKYGCY